MNANAPSVPRSKDSTSLNKVLPEDSQIHIHWYCLGHFIRRFYRVAFIRMVLKSVKSNYINKILYVLLQIWSKLYWLYSHAFTRLQLNVRNNIPWFWTRTKIHQNYHELSNTDINKKNITSGCCLTIISKICTKVKNAILRSCRKLWKKIVMR